MIFAIAVFTRLYYLSDFKFNPFFQYVYGYTDSYDYYIGAKNFAAGDMLAKSPSNRFSPLYTYFIGLFIKTTGKDLIAFWFFQFAMGALTVSLVFMIALELFNHRAAIFAAILYNFYGPALMYEGVLLRASLLTFLGTLSLYLLIQVLKKPGNLLILATGISISLFIQCRPNVALIFLLLPLLYLSPFDQKTQKLFLKIGGVALVLFFPLLYRSWLVHERFVLFDASGPAALLIGNHPDYPGIGLSKEHEYPGALGMNYGEMLSILLNRLGEQPIEMLGLYVRKLYYLFSSLEPYNNYDFLLFKQFSPLFNTPLSNFSLISSLALTGIIFRTGQRENIKLLYGFIGGISAAIILFYVLTRFRIPMVPYYAICAGYTVDSFMYRLKQSQWIKSVQMLVFGSFLLLLFNIPEFTRGIKQPYHDEINIQIGLNLVSNKRYSQAIEPLNNLLKNNPENIPALSAKALALGKIGERRRATYIYEKLVELEPENAKTHFNLATLYAESNKWKKASIHMKISERLFRQKQQDEWANMASEQINIYANRNKTKY
ncbi:MAG: tetratricopeptide repeat protein [Nitrospina sp.]|nr:tetratricopeptide repeat protein [Nitrospina sp.]